MTRLVRLYPRPWRDRYEAELLDLIEQRSLSPTDAIDLIRGAIDARLHPQSELPIPWTHRLPGVVALTTGTLWVFAVVIGSDRDDSSAIGTLTGFALMTMFISLPGDYLAAHRRRTGIGLGVLGLTVVLVNVIPWPIAAFIYLAAMVVFLAGTLTLAAIRAGVGSTARWRLVGGVVAVPAVALFAVSTTGLTDESVARRFVLLAIPYGVAWVLIGIRMVVRGSPTIVDPPPASEPPLTLELEIPA